jgi:hypothetical protein
MNELIDYVIIKRCTVCKEFKCDDEFSKKKKAAFGIRSACKICLAKIEKTKTENKIKEREKLNTDTTWKIIEGFSNFEVSKEGCVRKVYYKSILKGSLKNGYMVVKMKRDDGKYKNLLVHRLVALTFIFNLDPVNKVTVNHINKDTKDNRIENLEWASYKEQAIHKMTTGKKPTISKPFKSIIAYNDTETITFESVVKACMYINAQLNMKHTNENARRKLRTAIQQNKLLCDRYWKYESSQDLVDEIWKQWCIDNRRQISNMGRVKDSTGYINDFSNQKSKIYYQIDYRNKGYSVHIEVAKLFVENSDKEKYNIVNHLNSDKHDNRASNLEWTDVKGNNEHAIKTGEKNVKKVKQIDIQTNQIIDIFNTVREAVEKTGITQMSINRCASRKIKNPKKFRFEYV